jgi:hypothetical protein
MNVYAVIQTGDNRTGVVLAVFSTIDRAEACAARETSEYYDCRVETFVIDMDPE